MLVYTRFTVTRSTAISSRHRARPPKSVRLRQARLADIPSLIDLENQSFVSYYRPHRFTARDFQWYLTAPEALLLVAVKRKILGYISGRTGSPTRSGRIDSVAVAPQARGKEVGLQLAYGFLQKSKRKGSRSIWLEVGQKNAVAKALFAATGFRPYRKLRAYYGKGADALRLRASL